ncbi:TIGR04290 family methyltransferase [Ramlibacter sp. CrO1]|uniref:TIGR04290 family methyltransferase n=2 Tax=Ramlibacter algicola TaxID=2795217 RepID=A0A934PZW9_9BURK|nr:TIGR04290 family methyltransferase [Ramlibacter algicola]
MGTLVNAWIQRGGRAVGVRAGQAYVDTGTVHGYREALNLLGSRKRGEPAEAIRPATVCSASGDSLVKRPGDVPRRTTGRLFGKAEIERRVQELGDWFHNIDLLGVPTAPAHFLGDFPRAKFQSFAHVLPADLHGMTVLDIGCNAGFYSLEMKRRGADRVVGIDMDDYYLDQGRFAAEVLGQDVEFRRMPVYDVAQLGEKFDLVLFMGLVYHLRHPLLALDLVHEHVARDLLLYQSLQRGSADLEPIAPDHDFWETEVFQRPSYPRLHFVEHQYSHDETNWWIPNAACSAAMLRSAGFAVVAHPEEEVFLCKWEPLAPHPSGQRAVYPPRGSWAAGTA